MGLLLEDLMKIDIGPVTRIEGHLNVATTVENNRIVDAQCQGEMFRGLETILTGRSPLDAQQITQRICGVCPYAHAIASSMAQEAAYNIRAPENGRIMHNLIQGANHLYDYLLHFYQLCALDFIDITAIVRYTGKDDSLLTIQRWVKAELASGKPFPAAPFLPRLSGNYIDDDQVNIGALHNYLTAMDIQKKANRASAIFGGKFPHATAIFPSGCTQQARVDHIMSYRSLIKEVRTFILSKFIPDIEAVALFYPEYWKIGQSKGGFLSFGMLPLNVDANGARLFSGGVLSQIGGQVSRVDYNKIREDVGNSHYSSPSNLKIRDGQLTPSPNKGYSWIKAPRYDDQVMEVGPTARVLVDYAQGGNSQVRNLVDHYLARYNLEPSNLNSVLGRHLSRGICAVVIADFLLKECERLTPGQPTIADISIPSSCEGFGTTEATRGALLHYIRVENKKVAKYECVVPTTWNCSPKDDKGRPGALESALVGTNLVNPDEQIESNRIIHSFDPCIACAVH